MTKRTWTDFLRERCAAADGKPRVFDTAVISRLLQEHREAGKLLSEGLVWIGSGEPSWGDDARALLSRMKGEG